MKPGQAELARLRREVIKLKAKRDIFKSRGLLREGGARGLASRLLCLEDPVAECPGEGQRPRLWRAAGLARSPGRRGVPRSTSDRAADATRGVARPPQTAAAAVGYRDPVDECCGAECARSHVHGHIGQPQMGRRLHLPLDRRRLALRRGGGGSVLTPGRRLVDAGDDDHATGHGRPHDGDLAARQV